LAQLLNRYLGTNLGPWDVAALPEIYVSLVMEGMALREELAEAGLIGN